MKYFIDLEKSSKGHIGLVAVKKPENDEDLLKIDEGVDADIISYNQSFGDWEKEPSKSKQLSDDLKKSDYIRYRNNHYEHVHNKVAKKPDDLLTSDKTSMSTEVSSSEVRKLTDGKLQIPYNAGGEGKVTVLKNPTSSELLSYVGELDAKHENNLTNQNNKFSFLRYIVDEDNNIFFADAYEITHNDFSKVLGNTPYIGKGELFSESNLYRMLGDPWYKEKVKNWINRNSVEPTLYVNVNPMPYYHYSNIDNLTELDPSKYGTGITGAEKKRKLNDPINWVDRTYFYMDSNHQKEQGLGPFRYIAMLKPSELYDIAKDPDNLKSKAIDFGQFNVSLYEKLIKEAGYKGYWINDIQLGKIAATFDKVIVSKDTDKSIGIHIEFEKSDYYRINGKNHKLEHIHDKRVKHKHIIRHIHVNKQDKQEHKIQHTVEVMGDLHYVKELSHREEKPHFSDEEKQNILNEFLSRNKPQLNTKINPDDVKIILGLDNDNVLNHGLEDFEHSDNPLILRPNHVKRLNNLLAIPGTFYIGGSTWRLGHDVDSYDEMMAKFGVLPGKLIGLTGDLGDVPRGHEYAEWLATFGHLFDHIFKFYILDDRDDMEPFEKEEYLVKMKPGVGLSESAFKGLYELLHSGKQNPARPLAYSLVFKPEEKSVKLVIDLEKSMGYWRTRNGKREWVKDNRVKKEEVKNEKITIETVEEYLSKGEVGIMSAGKNTNDTEDNKLTEKDIQQRYVELEDELSSKQLSFARAKGIWKDDKGKLQSEDSFVIFDITKKQLADLGKKYHQDSVIHVNDGNNSFMYTTGENAGKAHTGKGYELITESNSDSPYTEVQTENGKIKFTFNLDFDTLKAVKLVIDLEKSDYQRVRHGKLEHVHDKRVKHDTFKELIDQIGKFDPALKEHSINVAKLSVKIAKKLNFPKEKLQELKYGGLVHDYGKLTIKPELLNETKSLKPEEVDKLHTHVIEGILKLGSKHLTPVIKNIVLFHHEKLDGDGYLVQKDIPLETQIVSVADTFEALTSDRRAYRKAMPIDEVIELLKTRVKEGKFNSDIVNALIAVINKE